jgi:hypothetical protein
VKAWIFVSVIIPALLSAAYLTPRHFGVAISGMIFPGLGHAMLGLKKRALTFFVLLSALYFAGVFLERDFYVKFGPGLLVTPEPEARIVEQRDDLEGTVDKVWKVVFVYAYPFFVGFGNYALGVPWSNATAPLIASVPGVLNTKEIPVTTRDIGYCFALLSGLLNLLVMMDAYDIACNRDELAKRKKATAAA